MNNSDIQIIRELQETKTTIKETSSSTLEAANRDVILTLLGISVPVTVAIFLFWLEQHTRRRNTIRRSCDTIMRELKETREALQNEERRIHRYFFKDSSLSNATPIQEIDYRNIIMITDAYNSILDSAFFTEFSSDTQHILSALYNRIKIHNRLVISISQFTERTQKMLEYELYLTEIESDITSLIFHSEGRVLSEMHASSLLSKLNEKLRLKRNFNYLPEYGG
jgi:hypothetical protein